jgi:hypothetical protein
VISEYDLKQVVEALLEELLVIETQSSAKGIIKLDGMARLVDIANSNMIKKLSNYNRFPEEFREEFRDISDSIPVQRSLFFKRSRGAQCPFSIGRITAVSTDKYGVSHQLFDFIEFTCRL